KTESGRAMFRAPTRFVILIALVAPAVFGLTTGPAGAATTQPRVVSAIISPPKVKLVGSGSTVTFDPSSLTVTDKNDGGCSPAHGEWVVTNKTSVKQVVFFHGIK